MERHEFDAKTAELVAEETDQPLQWFWLSFADKEGFKGVIVIQAQGIMTALFKCSAMNINPGGQVQSISIPTGQYIPNEAKNRLLSLAEIKQYFGEIVNSRGETV